MRALLRWTAAITGSLAVFAAFWAVCRYPARLDNGTALAIAGVPLAAALAVLAWWAAREPATPPAQAPDPASASAAGVRSQAATGNTGIIIGGDVRGATIRINSSQDGGQPLTAAAPRAGEAFVGGCAVVGDIPQRPPAFQPRDTLLAPLREHTSGPGICVIHAVTGMRGTGKTQAAAAYARQCVTDKWRLVAWVNADNTAAALDGLAEGAAAIGIPPGDDQPATARAMRHWLEAGGEQCLVVFDNAPDPDTLRPYLPVAGDAHIIITSTRQSITSLGTSIPVDVFTEPEALAYLAERTRLDDSNGARELVAELGYLPLALAQAAAVITAQHITYLTYLHRLRAFPLTRHLTRTEQDPYPHATAAAILLSLQTACDSDTTGLAAPLMNLVALLAPAGVTRTVLHATVPAGALTPPEPPAYGQNTLAWAAGQADVDAVLAHLAGASLLTFSLDGSAVTAHRLTMRVIREQRAHDGTLPAAGTAAITLLQTMTEMLVPVWRHAQAAKDLTQHITTLADHLAPGTDDHTAGTAEGLLRLRGWALTSLNDLGDNPALAISIGQALAADSERVLGSEHPATLAARNKLAHAYQAAAWLAEAITLHEATLAERERVLGSHHPGTIAARSKLAHAYREAGRAAEAITLHEATLADCERVLGSHHPDTLTARSNLTYAYRAATRACDAITQHEAALADRERDLGSDHPATLNSRNSLAHAYRDAGRTAEAISLHEATLADCERVLGSHHPDTLNSRNSLAYAYRAAGRLAEAMTLDDAIFADRQRVPGRNRPSTQASWDDPAIANQQAGRLADVITLYEQTLAYREQALGSDHPCTRASRNNLAVAYRQAGRLADAITLHEQILADRERDLGIDHPYTRDARESLATLRQQAE